MNLHRLFALVSAALLLPAQVLAEVNYYVEAVVSDAAAYEKSLGEWMQSADARQAGYRLTLMSVIANGHSPATHVIVSQVADYAGVDRLLRTADGSKDWRALQAATGSICKPDTEGHAVVLANYGAQRWEQGDVLAAIAMHIEDASGVESAFAELRQAALGRQAPGMVRLMRTMEGGAVSHYILVSASSFDALNRYFDAMRSSADYARFQGKSGTNAEVIGVRYLKVERVWSTEPKT